MGNRLRLTLSSLAVVALTLGATTGIEVSPVAAATVTVTLNNITYTADSGNRSGGASATGYTRVGGAKIIPASVTIAKKSYAVTSISSHAFEDALFTSVKIPASITTIGDYAFRNNLLMSVTIPAGVTTIGEAAFSTNRLTSVTIPNSVTTIGPNAFADNRLATVTIPNKVTTIANGAFSGNRLTSVTIPNMVTSIGAGAFGGNRLTSVTIPNMVTSIGAGAFGLNPLKTVTIPTGVTDIGEYAFLDNELTSVTIPSTVTSIGKAAFATQSFSSLLSSVLLIGAAPTISPSLRNRCGSIGNPNGSFGDCTGVTLYVLSENAEGYKPPWNGYTTAVAQTFTTVAPTITGTKKFGSTLTAVTTGWTPSADMTFSYVWSRATTSDVVPTPISGATKKTYKLVAADKGKYITVTVTSKKVGFVDASSTSLAGGTLIAR